MAGRRRQDPFSTNAGRPVIIINSRGGDLNEDTNVNKLDSEKETEEPVRELAPSGGARRPPLPQR